MAGLADLLSAPDPGSTAPVQINPQAVAAPISQAAPVNGKHHGVAGVARDILGTLGDFLLTRLHMPAMYAPAQHQRQLEEANQGFQQDPLGAIDRVSKVDFALGAKLRDQFIDNQRLAAAQADTAETRASRLGLLRAAQDDRTRQRASAMLGTMSNWDDARKQANYPQMRDNVLRYAKANGLDLSNELPANYDDNVVQTFVTGAIPEKTQTGQALSRDRMTMQNDRAVDRNDTTIRGQDLQHQDRQSSQGITTRGQDLAHGDRVRQQDLSHGDRVQTDKTRQRGQDIAHGDRPLKVGTIRNVGGKLWMWDGTKLVEPPK